MEHFCQRPSPFHCWSQPVLRPHSPLLIWGLQGWGKSVVFLQYQRLGSITTFPSFFRGSFPLSPLPVLVYWGTVPPMDTAHQKVPAISMLIWVWEGSLAKETRLIYLPPGAQRANGLPEHLSSGDASFFPPPPSPSTPNPMGERESLKGSTLSLQTETRPLRLLGGHYSSYQ